MVPHRVPPCKRKVHLARMMAALCNPTLPWAQAPPRNRRPQQVAVGGVRWWRTPCQLRRAKHRGTSHLAERSQADFSLGGRGLQSRVNLEVWANVRDFLLLPSLKLTKSTSQP